MLKNLIFDFDGVIADTHDINWFLSHEHDETATYEDFLAHHDGNVYAEPRIKFKPESSHLFFDEYRKRVTTSHLEKSIEPLKRLKEKYSLYIISSTSEPVIKEILEKSQILDIFVRILGQETHESKVEKFKMLMEDDVVTSENTVFVTDTLGDIKEAHKVGIKTIAETFGFHNRERLETGEPFKIVDSWEEIERTVDGL